jgi:hypothetical protein
VRTAQVQDWNQVRIGCSGTSLGSAQERTNKVRGWIQLERGLLKCMVVQERGRTQLRRGLARYGVVLSSGKDC